MKTSALTRCVPVLLLVCAAAPAAHAQNTVVPGQSAGRVRLGQSDPQVAKVLGGPAPANDAAMGGKNWATWFAGAKTNGNAASLPASDVRQVNVYFQRDRIRGEPSGIARARAIQVNSPFFHTVPGSITPGKSTLRDIHRAFPHATPSGNPQTLSNGTPVTFYTDTKRGIGFLISQATPRNQGRCLLLTVFRPGNAFPPYIK